MRLHLVVVLIGVFLLGALPGLVEHLAELQLDGSEAGQQAQIGLARQRGEQAVPDGGHQAVTAAPGSSSRSDSSRTTA